MYAQGCSSSSKLRFLLKLLIGATVVANLFVCNADSEDVGDLTSLDSVELTPSEAEFAATLDAETAPSAADQTYLDGTGATPSAADLNSLIGVASAHSEDEEDDSESQEEAPVLTGLMALYGLKKLKSVEKGVIGWRRMNYILDNMPNGMCDRVESEEIRKIIRSLGQTLIRSPPNEVPSEQLTEKLSKKLYDVLIAKDKDYYNTPDKSQEKTDLLDKIKDALKEITLKDHEPSYEPLYSEFDVSDYPDMRPRDFNELNMRLVKYRLKKILNRASFYSPENYVETMKQYRMLVQRFKNEHEDEITLPLAQMIAKIPPGPVTGRALHAICEHLADLIISRDSATHPKYWRGGSSRRKIRTANLRFLIRTAIRAHFEI